MLKRNVLLAAAALFMVSPLTVTESQAQGLETFFVMLNGGNECDGTAPPAGPICRVGAPRAFGSATVTLITPTSLCVGIVVDNLAGATAVHIHSGPSSFNGGVVVSISPPLPPPNPPGGGNPGTTSGCIAGIPVATITGIRNNPQNFYLNVHNAAFPNGAIRGQLF